MAKQTASRGRGKTTQAVRRRGLICPKCGFRAAHAAGLGRHRSAIHGTISQRELAERDRKRGTPARRATGDAQLTKRVADLERRYDRLLVGLEQILKKAKRQS